MRITPQVAIGLNVDAPEHGGGGGGGGGGGSDWPTEATEISGTSLLLFVIAVLLYSMCGGGQDGAENNGEGGGAGGGAGGAFAGLLSDFLRVCPSFGALGI